MPFIRVKTGPNKGKSHEITRDVITIGRDESQTIQILDQGVSRQHAEIFRIGEMCFIRDLESTNGTSLNGARIAEEMLQNDDEMLIGTTVMQFLENLPDPADEEPETVTLEDTRLSTPEKDIEKALPPKGAPARPVSQEALSRNVVVVGQIAAIIAAEGDAEAVIARSLDLMTQMTKASQMFLLRSDRAAQRVVVRCFSEAEDFSGPRKLSRTILKHVFQVNRPILTIDAAVDERFNLSESVVLQKIRSVVCAPIAIQPDGGLFLYAHLDSADRRFSLEDLELISLAAFQLGPLLSHRERAQRREARLSGALRAVVHLVEARLPGQAGHHERVAHAAVALGEQLGIDADRLEDLRVAAWVHDVGKIALEADADPKDHVTAAERLLRPFDAAGTIVPIVLHHHERADGTGYPLGLKNDALPVESRVLIVANAFDNLCAGGGDAGSPIDPREAVKAISMRGGGEFDDEVIKALLVCHRDGSLYTGTAS